MKKIMFISPPISGHVNPQLNLCRELASKDVKLIYYTFEKYYEKFDDIKDIELRKYPDSFLQFYTDFSKNQKLQKQFMNLLYVIYSATEELLPFMMAEVEKEKPDLIICDTLAIWGRMVAKYYNISTVYFVSSFMCDKIMMKKMPSLSVNLLSNAVVAIPYVIKFISVIKRLEKKYGKIVDPPWKMIDHDGKFTIVVTSKEFHPGGNEYPENVRFAGPAFVDYEEIVNEKDTIFISLGTITFSDKFWDCCIEATKDLGYQVAVTFGGNKNNKVNIKTLPNNVKIYDNLSLKEYREVLKKSALFISHGGFNSVSDAILYETPIIICPGHTEHINTGKVLEADGCGSLFMSNKKHVNMKKLKMMASKVLNDENIKQNLKKYRQSFLNSPGYGKIVEELNEKYTLF